MSASVYQPAHQWAYLDTGPSLPDDLPSELKVGETPFHREATEVMAFAAKTLLGDEVEIFRNMNWYPVDDGNAVAPDIMVLPAVTLDRSPDDRPKSYRQDQLAGPAPSVVVEVPSDSDTWTSMRAKTERYRLLGSVVYVVSVDSPVAVDRFGLDAPDPVSWTDRPIPELGGLRIQFDHDDQHRLFVVMPDGTRGSDHAELGAALARSRTEALERQLRELGVEPEGDQ